MKIKICLLLLVLILCSTLCVGSGKEYFNQKVPKQTTVTLVGKESRCMINNTPVFLAEKAYMFKGEPYLPVKDILTPLGYAIDWDENLSAVVCTKDGIASYVFPSRNNIWIGSVEYMFENEPLIISNRAYVSSSMFEALTGAKVLVRGVLEEYKYVTLIGCESRCIVNGVEVPLYDKAYQYKGQAYLPIDDILPALGYAIGWDYDLSAVVCTKDGIVSYVFPSSNNIWVGAVEHIFEDKPLIIENRAYVSAQMFATLTGSRVLTEGQLFAYKSGSTIANSVPTDAYRLSGNSIIYGGGVCVVDGFGMELVTIPEQKAIEYAAVINSVAASLDSHINVYNMIVPTAAEFYAPASLYPNQLSGIQTVYANLSDRVTSVNVYDILSSHAGEKLYFKTDHHWTQRGAYYAYKEFMEYKGVAVPDIATFVNFPSKIFVGSLEGFAGDTQAGNIMRSSPELLERYMPIYASTGTVYYDQYLTAVGRTVKAVDTGMNSYSSFIGGDSPITIFDTNVKNGKTIVIVKESFGNAFATWAMNDFSKVCIIDPRNFNGFDGYLNTFNLNNFCRTVGATDVMFINYPVSVSSDSIRLSISKMK